MLGYFGLNIGVEFVDIFAALTDHQVFSYGQNVHFPVDLHGNCAVVLLGICIRTRHFLCQVCFENIQWCL